MPQEPTKFDAYVLSEILEAKANFLGLCCAALIPGQIARLDISGNMSKCREFLAARNAKVKEFKGRSEVWVRSKNGEDVKIGEFFPEIKDDKLVLEAYVAGIRVDVGAPILPTEPIASDN